MSSICIYTLASDKPLKIVKKITLSNVAVRLPQELYRPLKVRLAETGETFQGLIVRLLREWLYEARTGESSQAQPVRSIEGAEHEALESILTGGNEPLKRAIRALLEALAAPATGGSIGRQDQSTAGGQGPTAADFAATVADAERVLAEARRAAADAGAPDPNDPDSDRERDPGGTGQVQRKGKGGTRR